MKKNLLSIIILALLVVNLVLTTIMMISVRSAAVKTSALISDIAGAMKLELSSGAGAGAMRQDVPMEDVAVYKIENQMTIPLKVGENGEAHFCMVSVALSMNTKSEGYKTYGADISSKESLITSVIYDVVGNYTLEEAQADKDGMRNEILKEIQAMFDSDFIFQVAFSDIIFQ